MHALRGLLSITFLYNLNTKNGFSFTPPGGTAPWTPEVCLPPLTIYPGTPPVTGTYKGITFSFLAVVSP